MGAFWFVHKGLHGVLRCDEAVFVEKCAFAICATLAVVVAAEGPIGTNIYSREDALDFVWDMEAWVLATPL